MSRMSRANIKDYTVVVEDEIYSKAWGNWVDFHYRLECDQLMERFCNFVDPGDKNPYVLDYWGCADQDEPQEALPEIARRLQLLAGPHYHTVIKAYYARHPWK